VKNYYGNRFSISLRSHFIFLGFVDEVHIKKKLSSYIPGFSSFFGKLAPFLPHRRIVTDWKIAKSEKRSQGNLTNRVTYFLVFLPVVWRVFPQHKRPHICCWILKLSKKNLARFSIALKTICYSHNWKGQLAVCNIHHYFCVSAGQ
jgi:hypothetical protein